MAEWFDKLMVEADIARDQREVYVANLENGVTRNVERMKDMTNSELVESLETLVLRSNSEYHLNGDAMVFSTYITELRKEILRRLDLGWSVGSRNSIPNPYSE